MNDNSDKWRRAVEEKQQEKRREQAEKESRCQSAGKQGEVIRGIFKSMGIKSLNGTRLRKDDSGRLSLFYPYKEEIIGARDSGAFISFLLGHYGGWCPWSYELDGIDKYGECHEIIKIDV